MENYKEYLIENDDSRKKFNQVLQSFYSENYEAAILLLFNLTVDDLYDKLLEMDKRKLLDIEDDIANLESIIESENFNRYSQLEAEVYKIYKNKSILDKSTISMLEYLKKVRDSCAHPTFSKEFNRPVRQSTVRMFMDNIYNNILIVKYYIKDPYEYVKEIIEKDVWGNNFYDTLGSTDREKQIKSLSKLLIPALNNLREENKIKLFRSLFNMIFNKNNKDTRLYQYQRFLAITILLDNIKKNGFIEEIKVEFLNLLPDYNLLLDEPIGKTNSKLILRTLSLFLFLLKENKIFLDTLKSENNEMIIYLKEQLFEDGDLLLKYFNLFEADFSVFFSDNYKKFNWEVFLFIFENKNINSDKKEMINFLEYLVKRVPKAAGFKEADITYEVVFLTIEKLSLDKNDLADLLDVMNKNDQFYHKKRQANQYYLKNLNDLLGDLSMYKELYIDLEGNND